MPSAGLWKWPDEFAEELVIHEEVLEKIRAVKKLEGSLKEDLDLEDMGDLFRSLRYGKQAIKSIRALKAMDVEGRCLLALLTEHQINWRHINYGFQFQLSDGTQLSWWPSTGKMTWQTASRQAANKTGAKTPSEFITEYYLGR